MDLMNLLGGKPVKSEQPMKGVEVPGTISIYLVRMPDGRYYKGTLQEGPLFTDEWADAKFFFVAVGMMQAKRIAEQLGGQVYLVSCTPPEPYRG